MLLASGAYMVFDDELQMKWICSVGILGAQGFEGELNERR